MYGLGSCFGITGVSYLFCKAASVLSSLLPLLLALGVVYLVWGIVQYVIGDAEEAKKKGKDKIIYGIIGLAIIISLWGLVTILRDTFGLRYSPGAPYPYELRELLP
ncbi:MAG: hypothetical protein AAB500_02020 [Patescibacteria group bacterium]|mgnify:CR=1 FL=1